MSKLGLSFEAFHELIVDMGKTVKSYVDEGNAALAARMAELERRQAAFKYLGTWTSGRSYSQGNFVSQSGSIWHCDESGTTQRPGDGPGWTLAVKRGQNGTGGK